MAAANVTRSDVMSYVRALYGGAALKMQRKSALQKQDGDVSEI